MKGQCFEGHASVSRKTQWGEPMSHQVVRSSLSQQPLTVVPKELPLHHHQRHTPSSLSPVLQREMGPSLFWEFRIGSSSAWIHEKWFGYNQFVFICARFSALITSWRTHSFLCIWWVSIHCSHYPFNALIVMSRATGSTLELASVSFGSDPSWSLIVSLF